VFFFGGGEVKIQNGVMKILFRTGAGKNETRDDISKSRGDTAGAISDTCKETKRGGLATRRHGDTRIRALCEKASGRDVRKGRNTANTSTARTGVYPFGEPLERAGTARFPNMLPSISSFDEDIW